MQLGLPPETSVNKKRGSNWTTEEEILLIEEVLKYEGTLFGKMKGSGGGAWPNERVNLEGHSRDTLKLVKIIPVCYRSSSYFSSISNINHHSINHLTHFLNEIQLIPLNFITRYM